MSTEDQVLLFGHTIVGVITIIGIIVWTRNVEENECPRVILGYNHKNKGCDHSKKLVLQAKQTIKESNEKGDIHVIV